ncbi:MAG: rod shape-determining protein MreD [Acetobacteraceae bacterium]
MARDDQHPGIRPRLTLGRRLDIAARYAFPACVTVVLMLVVEVPLRLALQTALLPAVALISVWFWSVYRPIAMAPPVVFLIGLLLDLRGYLPLGVGVLTLLIAHGISQRWRRFLMQQGFAMTWLAFLPIATGGAALIWVLTALLTFRLLPLGPALFLAVLSFALYPVLAMPLTVAHRSLADPEQA